MTPGNRAQLKLAVDLARRARAAVLIATHGADSCDYCTAPLEPKPRQRFCSERCRKRWSWGSLNRRVAA